MIVTCSILLILASGRVGLYDITGVVVANDLENGKYLIDFERGFKSAGAARSDNKDVQWVSSDQCEEIKNEK